MDKPTQAEVKKRINDILVDKLGCDYEDLHEEAKMGDDIGADSLDMVELEMEFEKEFDITLGTNVITTRLTVAEMHNIVYNTIHGIKASN